MLPRRCSTPPKTRPRHKLHTPSLQNPSEWRKHPSPETSDVTFPIQRRHLQGVSHHPHLRWIHGFEIEHRSPVSQTSWSRRVTTRVHPPARHLRVFSVSPRSTQWRYPDVEIVSHASFFGRRIHIFFNRRPNRRFYLGSCLRGKNHLEDLRLVGRSRA